MADTTLNILITATNQAKASIDELVKRLAGVSDTLGEIKPTGGLLASEKTLKELGKSAKDTGHQVSDLSERFHSLGEKMHKLVEIIHFVTKGFLAFEAVRMVKEVADVAARADELQIVLYQVGKNAGYTRDQLDAADKAVQKMGITAESSRQSLTRLMQAELDLASATALARGAQDLAVVSGLNSSETFSRLVTAIQTMNTQMLRFMGIIIDREQAYADATAKFGVALDEHGKKLVFQAAVQAELIKLTGAYDHAMTSASKQLGSMARFSENLLEAMGKGLQPAYLALIVSINRTLDALTHFFEKTDKSKQVLNGLGEAVDAAKGPIDLLADAIWAVGGALEGVIHFLTEYKSQIGTAIKLSLEFYIVLKSIGLIMALISFVQGAGLVGVLSRVGGLFAKLGGVLWPIVVLFTVWGQRILALVPAAATAVAALGGISAVLIPWVIGVAAVAAAVWALNKAWTAVTDATGKSDKVNKAARKTFDELKIVLVDLNKEAKLYKELTNQILGLQLQKTKVTDNEQAARLDQKLKIAEDEKEEVYQRLLEVEKRASRLDLEAGRQRGVTDEKLLKERKDLQASLAKLQRDITEEERKVRAATRAWEEMGFILENGTIISKKLSVELGNINAGLRKMKEGGPEAAQVVLETMQSGLAGARTHADINKIINDGVAKYLQQQKDNKEEADQIRTQAVVDHAKALEAGAKDAGKIYERAEALINAKQKAAEDQLSALIKAVPLSQKTVDLNTQKSLLGGEATLAENSALEQAQLELGVLGLKKRNNLVREELNERNIKLKSALAEGLITQQGFDQASLQSTQKKLDLEISEISAARAKINANLRKPLPESQRKDLENQREELGIQIEEKRSQKRLANDQAEADALALNRSAADTARNAVLDLVETQDPLAAALARNREQYDALYRTLRQLGLAHEFAAEVTDKAREAKDKEIKTNEALIRSEQRLATVLAELSIQQSRVYLAQQKGQITSLEAERAINTIITQQIEARTRQLQAYQQRIDDIADKTTSKAIKDTEDLTAKMQAERQAIVDLTLSYRDFADELRTVTTNALTTFLMDTVNHVKTMKEAFKDFIRTIRDTVEKRLFQDFSERLIANMGSLWQSITQSKNDIFGDISKLLFGEKTLGTKNNPMYTRPADLPGAAKATETASGGLWEGLKKLFGFGGSAGSRDATTASDDALALFFDDGGKESSDLQTITDPIVALVDVTGNTLKEGFGGLSNKVSGGGLGFGDFFSSIGNVLAGLWKSLKGLFSGGSSGTGFLSSAFTFVKGLFAAEGGLIQGPGTGTSDSVPAWVSNGEYVVPADKVRKYLPWLEAMRADNLPAIFETLMGQITPSSPKVPRFAGGGLAGTPTSVQLPSRAQSPGTLQVVLHDSALRVTMRDWLEGEIGRVLATR